MDCRSERTAARTAASLLCKEQSRLLVSGFPSNPCDSLADIGHLWWAWPPSNPLPLSGTAPIAGRRLSGVMAPAAEATGRRDGDGDVAGFALLVSKEKERPWNATERLLVVVVVAAAAPALGPPASPTAALPGGPGRGRSTETERLGSGDAKRREGVDAEVEVEVELEVVVVDVEVEVDVDLEGGARR